MHKFPDLVDRTYFRTYRKFSQLMEQLSRNWVAGKPFTILPVMGYFVGHIFVDDTGATLIPVGFDVKTKIDVAKFISTTDGVGDCDKVLPKSIVVEIDSIDYHDRYRVVNINNDKALFIYFSGRLDDAIAEYRIKNQKI